MQLIRALIFFGLLGFSYGSNHQGLLRMPTFPKECIYSGIPQYDRMKLNCWALMLKPEIDGCPHTVDGMEMSKFFFDTSNTLCDNEVHFFPTFKSLDHLSSIRSTDVRAYYEEISIF